MPQFLKCRERRNDMFTIELYEFDGKIVANWFGPVRAGMRIGAAQLPLGPDAQMPAERVISQAVRLAGTKPICVVDPSGLWRPEWGDLIDPT